jgi:hypothetical protein
MMIRKFGFAHFTDSEVANTPRPATAAAAAKPACCKNLRLLNILIPCSILLNDPTSYGSEIIISGNREFVI